jgi:Peptidase family M28
VEIEPFLCHPQYALVHALHAALAVVGSLLATSIPALGFGLVLVAASSTYLDLNTRFYLARRLFFRRASQNVVSPGSRPEAPARLVLVAHYDAARTGWIFTRGLRRSERLSKRARLPLSPFRVFFWGGIAPLLPVLAVRMAGYEPVWVTLVQLVPTVILVAAIFLLIDIALSHVVPGANDNASGVAAVLSAAEELGRQPLETLDLWVVLTGSEESLAEGMRSWVRAQGGELDPGRTLVLNVDSVSHGPVGYEVSLGPVITVPLDSGLVERCEALAEAQAGPQGNPSAQPLSYALLDDALPAQLRGLSSITIREAERSPWYHTAGDVPERVDGKTLTKATEFVCALARLIDRELSRDGAGGTAEREPAPAAPVEAPDAAPGRGW